MKKWMQLIRRTYLAPVIVMIVMLAFLFAKGAESAYTITFWESELTITPENRIVLIASGGNMLRVNCFYVNGKRVDDCTVEKMTYEKCRVTFDPAVFSKGNAWYELRVGYHKWGFINLLSSPVWVEWTGS